VSADRDPPIDEFFGLARDYLLCRLFIMGGECPETRGQYSLKEWLEGMTSYATEMELLVQERRR
jgi:hypothetical protein